MGFISSHYDRLKSLGEAQRKLEQEPKSEPAQPESTKDTGNSSSLKKTDKEVLDFMANSAVYNNINIQKKVK